MPQLADMPVKATFRLTDAKGIMGRREYTKYTTGPRMRHDTITVPLKDEIESAMKPTTTSAIRTVPTNAIVTWARARVLRTQ
mmetsp:Transcript_26896/g.75590  ORF Transcript_26896/g.75590 Transcript_26896/m.75590 type:complete len:82 (-) Transcript_26896:860-1105(-)